MLTGGERDGCRRSRNRSAFQGLNAVVSLGPDAPLPATCRRHHSCRAYCCCCPANRERKALVPAAVFFSPQPSSPALRRNRTAPGSPSAPSVSPGTKFLSTPTRSPPRCASFWEISIKKSL